MKSHIFELFDCILLLAGEIVELLLHLVDLSLQVGHLAFRRIKITLVLDHPLLLLSDYDISSSKEKAK